MIRFNVLFKGNRVADCEAPCFGWLSRSSDLWYRNSKLVTQVARPLAEGFTTGQEKAQELVWYVSKSEIPGGGVKSWPIVQEIVKAFPWLDDTVLLRPETKTVHVKLGDTPCDQSILCMGIIRNYFMVPSFPQAYNKARELGASVQEAHIFAALIECHSDWRNRWSCTSRHIWEYDAVHSASFGVAALKAMTSPNYKPWTQDNWNNQAGYNREQTLDDRFVNLDGVAYGRKLLDTFSVENDREIIPNQLTVHATEDEEVVEIINHIRNAINN